jgi:hypothetical protein
MDFEIRKISDVGVGHPVVARLGVQASDLITWIDIEDAKRVRPSPACHYSAEIQAAPDDTARAVQEARHRSLEARLRDIRLMGDAVIAAFFAEDKPKAREKQRAEVESWLTGSMEMAWKKFAVMAATLHHGTHPVAPFHWEVEFPEVFLRENGGFHAMIGNPPFLGGLRVSNELGMDYFRFIENRYSGAGYVCDLCAYFFRRAFDLIRQGGVVGFLATNTIGQGTTREGGLGQIRKANGRIIRATRRLRWPGEFLSFTSLKELSQHPVTLIRSACRSSVPIFLQRMSMEPQRVCRAKMSFFPRVPIFVAPASCLVTRAQVRPWRI